MISSISFKGTYKVNNENMDAFYKFQKYAGSKEFEDGVSTKFRDKINKRGINGCYDYFAEQTLIVPDSMDNEVETFCANNGIKYTKYETKDLLNPQTIDERIEYPPVGYRKVEVDTEKLEKLIQNQQNNIDHCQSDYNKYYKDKVENMLRDGSSFPATTLTIYPRFGSIDDLKHYVDNYGPDRLNENQVIIDFNQETDNPDHCVYFALRDMGLNKVPVYVDDATYEAGSALGLFK